MKKLIYTFVIVLFIGTLNAQWVQVPSGTFENLNDIQFVDANTGFAVGNAGVVLKTTNGGQNWTIKNTNSTYNNLCLFFLNNNTGYIGHVNFKLLFTTDGGENWTIKNTYGGNSFTSLFFLNQSTGYATASNNSAGLFSTIDGAYSWGISFPYYCKSIKFLNNTFGFCVSRENPYNKALIYNGNAWTSYRVNYITNSNYLNSIDFISTTIGYTVGDSGKIFKTLNGGNNWTSQNNYTSNNLKSVKAIDLNKVITVGNNGTIKATSNGGTTWYTQNSTTTNNLNSLYMLNSTIGFIVGDIGTILKTTNGGVWVKKIDEIIPINYELQQNYPNPFNPITKIRFSIPSQGFVRLKIYDVNGKSIETLVDNNLSAGIYETMFDASNLNSGIYFIRLETITTTITKKLSFIK